MARIHLTATPGRRSAATPRHCRCGCGEMTRGGQFRPGHDGALYGLALRISEGGSAFIAEAVDKGWADDRNVAAAIAYGRERGLAMELPPIEEDLTDALNELVEGK